MWRNWLYIGWVPHATEAAWHNCSELLRCVIEVSDFLFFLIALVTDRIEVQRDVWSSKSEKKTILGGIGFTSRRHASPKFGQDRVRGSNRPLLACHISCKRSSLAILKKNVKFVNMFQFDNKVKSWCNVWSMERVNECTCNHPQECRATVFRGRLDIVL